MKKFSALMALLALAVFVFSGCSNKTSEIITASPDAEASFQETADDAPTDMQGSFFKSVVNLLPDQNAAIGPDGDEITYNIRVQELYDDDDSATGVQLTIDDVELGEIAGSFESAFAFLDTQGQTGVILSVDTEYEEFKTYVYKIEPSSMNIVGEYPYIIDAADGDGSVLAIGIVEFFGSWSAAKLGVIKSDFSIELGDEYMLVSTDGYRDLTVRKDITSGVSFKQGDDYKEGQLKLGDVISPCATDGETYLLFTTKDGKEGRIQAERGEYGDTYINGTEVSELFDNIIIAG